MTKTDKQKTSDFWPKPVVGREDGLQRVMKKHLGLMEIFYTIVVKDTQIVYIYQKSSTAHLKLVNFILGQFHL